VWTGSFGNTRYLDPLRDVFDRLMRERVAELTVVCSDPWEGPARFVRWTRYGETEALSHADVGIMPLSDGPYTRGKAGFKLLMYMGVGAAVVASPVGVNSYLVEESGAGLLATSPGDWEGALRHLAAQHDERRAMGAAGRSFVLSYADIERHAAVALKAIEGPVIIDGD
jgi:glycosyltransferase involved in cell wall biosynthesis